MITSSGNKNKALEKLYPLYIVEREPDGKAKKIFGFAICVKTVAQKIGIFLDRFGDLESYIKLREFEEDR